MALLRKNTPKQKICMILYYFATIQVFWREHVWWNRGIWKWLLMPPNRTKDHFACKQARYFLTPNCNSSQSAFIVWKKKTKKKNFEMRCGPKLNFIILTCVFPSLAGQKERCVVNSDWSYFWYLWACDILCLSYMWQICKLLLLLFFII